MQSQSEFNAAGIRAIWGGEFFFYLVGEDLGLLDTGLVVSYFVLGALGANGGVGQEGLASGCG